MTTANCIAEIATRVPSLANGDYKIVKDAKGNVIRNSVTFSIRKDAKWSDGTPITPKDFQFWLKVEQDERVPVPTRDPWDKAKITVQDADTFTITFDPPYLFADQITSSVGLNPAPSAAMEKAWNAFDAATKKLDPKTGAKQITDEWNKFIAQFTTPRGLPKVVSGPFKPTDLAGGQQLGHDPQPQLLDHPQGRGRQVPSDGAVPLYHRHQHPQGQHPLGPARRPLDGGRDV